MDQAVGFALLSISPLHEKEVYKSLEAISEIVDLHPLFGEFDILIKIQAQNIDAIGTDLDMNQGGGCGKGGQSPLPVSNGSPHIRINNCLVGGA